MRIHICLVSSNADVNALVRKERHALIPSTLRERLCINKNLHADFSVTVYDPKIESKLLPEYLLKNDKNQVIVLLLDTPLSYIADKISCACFVYKVDLPTNPKPKNYKNYLTGAFSKSLKTLANFLSIIDDGANEQVMLLPFRNFKAQSLIDLRETCKNDTHLPDFINKIQSLVQDLKNRRRPRRKSNYPDQYFADDEEKLFHYGLERHAKLATGNPHTPVCELTGKYRFGKKIETDRHYNVTKECKSTTKISGQFHNCHDQIENISTRTHLNMFNNDYIA